MFSQPMMNEFLIHKSANRKFFQVSIILKIKMIDLAKRMSKQKARIFTYQSMNTKMHSQKFVIINLVVREILAE